MRVASFPGGAIVYPRQILCSTVLVLLAFAASASSATLRVCASGCSYSDVQRAVDAAAPGDTILLRAGETFTGHVVLRRKSGDARIVIRSDASDSELPAPGVRLVPSGRPGANTAVSRLARLRGRGATWRTTPVVGGSMIRRGGCGSRGGGAGGSRSHDASSTSSTGNFTSWI